MPPSPQLARFVDDELLRAPVLLAEVLQAAIDAARAAAPLDRACADAFAAAVAAGQAAATERFVASLREQAAAFCGAGGPPRTRGAAKLSALALVDDAEVAADIELSRVVQAIKHAAEHELRELRTFTSALVGDVDVARDTNPFRPETYARALWEAIAVLALGFERRVALMRHAAQPLARALRLAYAAACTRLEDAGVEPGVYRTIVLPGGGRPLSELRDSMPAPLDAVAIAPSRSRQEHQLESLMTRLFDALVADSSVALDVRVLISRLRHAALRVAQRDPTLLASYAHPVWRFIDRANFVSEVHADPDDPQRERLVAIIGGLVDELLREPAPDAALFRWALKRLRAYEKHQSEQRLKRHRPMLESLRQALDERGVPENVAAVDVGTLETVPAELLSLDTTPRRGATPALEPGDWVRTFRGGGHCTAQLLWHDTNGELWLLADADGDSAWALTRAALDRLHAEGLLDELVPRSLVERAADAVRRGVDPAR